MSRPSKKTWLTAPLMHSFRAAHRARDARAKLDLRDESGERVVAGRRASVRSVVTEAVLRREVSQHLDMLMNTVQLASALDLSEHEHVRRSILNFGLPEVAHRSMDEVTVDDVRDEIATAMRSFEPRIMRESIHITRHQGPASNELKVRFVIQADLSCDPVPVPVELVAELEIDSGRLTLSGL